MCLPFGSAVPLLGIYAGDMSVYAHKVIHRRTVIETLFLVVQSWKQLRCAKAGIEISKFLSNEILHSSEKDVQTVRYYVVNNLKYVILRTGNQKGMYYVNIFI